MALVVPILSTFDGRGIQRAINDFKRLKTSGEKTGFIISKAFLPAVGALAGLAFASGKAIQAAIQDEAAQASLARTLRVSAQATDETVASVERYITSLGKSIGVTDDEARPAFATLALATKDVGKAQELLAIALDTSAATGKPLADVAEALSKGFAGNTRGLKQLSPELFKLIKDGASAAEAFAVLEANFGGAAQTAAGTTAGQFKILQTSINETKEEIGLALLPIVQQILPLFQKMAEFVSNNVSLILAMGTAIGVLSAAIVAMRIAMVVAAAASYGLAAGLTAVQIATGFGVIAVVAGVAAFAAYKLSMKGAKDAADKAATSLDELSLATDTQRLRTKSAIENEEKSAVATTLAKLAAEAKAKAISGASSAISKAQSILSAYTSALQGLGSAQKGVTDAAKNLTSAKNDQRSAFYGLIIATEAFNKVSKGYGATSKQAKDATRDLAQAQRDAVRANISLRNATQSVTEAQQKLDDLRSGKAANRATEDLASATAQVADAQKKLDAAFIQGGQDTISDAVGRLNDAYDRQKQATDAIREAQDASDPAAIADAEDALTSAKLDLEEATLGQADATQKVLDNQLLLTQALTGATSETDIYKEAAKQMKDAQDALRTANDGVTTSLYDQANAQRELNNAKADLTGATTGTTAGQRKSASKRTGIKIPKLGAGGIVNRPTLAMIGEAGAEAVIPLDRMNNGNVFNITVNAGVGDPVAIGREVVNVLQAYQRRSGAIPIKVA